MTATVSDLVEKLRGEWELLSGFSIDRGSVDAGISANLAAEAADRIEALERERDARQEDSDSYKAERHGSKMRYPYADVIPFRRPAPPHKPSQE